MTTKNFAILLVCISILIFSYCRSAKRKTQSVIEVNYDEKNFIVKDSITGQSGNSAITFYVGKLDSSVGMVKKFWYNDRVKSCIFFRNGQKSGPQKLYDSTGKIMYDGFYLHDKRTGLSLYYYADSLISVEIYEDGVKLPLEPAQEDKIVTMLNH